MAINKEKNVNIQITFPKEDADQLDRLIVAYSNNKIKTTRSEVLLVAFRDYLRKLVMIGQSMEKKKANKKVEEPQGDKKDA
ncbi:MAG: hypothetical protein J6S85_21410 [Methanobrevibacter sp.]|nr:hypothetical protein [Methanobrevibacter sp.]